jgi:methylmalonyl-CoA mutase
LQDRVIPLAAGFERATREDWLALAAKTLKGADPETLVRRTLDGIAVHPLYGPGEAGSSPGFVPAPRPSDRPWDIRTAVAQPDPAEANSDILADLDGGAASVLISIDPRGDAGVAVGSADALARVLEGVITDLAPVALDAAFMGPACADWLGAAAKASPAAPLLFHLDPISAFAVSGVSPGPMESHLIATANVGVRLAPTYPKAGLFLASGRVVHEAGGSEAEELAFAASAAVAYAKALVRAGLPLEAAFGRIILGLSVDATPFLSIAKLRAARIVFGRIVRACGVADFSIAIEARSSQRMLTRAEPWTNLVRLTTAGFAAVVGGADAVILGNFTDAVGPPTGQSRRLARNTQLILMEEAHLGAVADPLAGAGSVEALTADLAAAAWERFAAMEAAGGIVEALRCGLVAGEVDRARERLRLAISKRESRIVGVTDFVDDAPAAAPVAVSRPRSAVEAPDPRLPGHDSHCPALVPLRLEALAA